MAIDVSDAMLSPDLATRFTVSRRPEQISEQGRSVVTPTLHPRICGVVTSSSGNDLDRLDDNQRMGRHLTIVTKFRLRGPTPGFQPDVIIWNGNSYVVQHIDPYPQFGVGFVQAIVGSIDSIDQPVPEPAPTYSQLNFSRLQNSQLLPIGMGR